jgi:hypothetical protein
MLFLIDTRERRPSGADGGRPAWEPNWRLWRWVALTVVAAVAAGATTGLVAYLLICATIAFASWAVCEIVPDTFGLKDYRQ